MHWVDWLIVGICLTFVAAIGLYTQQFVKGVSDFLAAGRVAGRYVLCVAGGEAMFGLISVVAIWEMMYKSGFALGFWQQIGLPVSLIVTLTGFCIYRYRETRSMTLGQLFEIRYSRRFRVFAGVLQSISGIINYGLFPAVGARFVMYFCGLPPQLTLLGVQWPTFAILMAVILCIGVILATLGGQITVMTTDCLMGMVSYPIYLIVVVVILSQFSWWGEMVPALTARPAGQSMLNPFDTADLRDFNLFYVFVGIFASVYGGGLSWGAVQSYNSAAINAHEQKMARILGTWRGGFLAMMMMLTAIAAYTYFNSPTFQSQAEQSQVELQALALQDTAPGYLSLKDGVGATRLQVDGAMDQLKNEDPSRFAIFETITKQMTVPKALSDILPVGVLGLFCALMIFLMISTDTTYLHGWGSILVQDIVLPLRKKPFSPKEQIFWLRMAIACVAIYAFLFSFFFGQVTYILMFFAITGAIWAGAGAAIVLGLYWSRGTTAGAWTSLISGAAIAAGGFLLINLWPGHLYPAIAANPLFLAWLTWAVEAVSAPMEPIILWRVQPERFFMNGQEINFIAMVVAITGYFTVSLATCRQRFNMDRMLHRGAYRREDDRVPASEIVQARKKGIRAVLKALSGIDENFSRGDRILSWSVLIYSLGYQFMLMFVAVLIWNFVAPWPSEWWIINFFVTGIVISSLIGIVSTIWFSIGGTIDLFRMFQRLKSREVDLADDGRVEGNQNAEDLSSKPISEPHRRTT